jgi:hypothetical protein
MKSSSSSHERRSTTARRIAAFCPPPNETSAIVPKTRAIAGSDARRGSDNVCGERSVGVRMAVLAGEDVDVDVLGVLIRR